MIKHFFERISTYSKNKRMAALLVVNTLATTLSLLIALLSRFEFNFKLAILENYFFSALVLLLASRTCSYILYEINSMSLRHTSIPELKVIAKAHVLSSLLFMSSIYFVRVGRFPRSVILTELFISILVTLGIRLLIRELNEMNVFKDLKSDSSKRDVIVIGAGDSGHLIVKNLLNEKKFNFNPVAVLDDSERLIGGYVHRVKVLGSIKMLGNLLLKNPDVSAVIVAIPSFPKTRYEEIKEICKNYNVQVKKLQSFADIACLDINVIDKSPDIESMLEKQKEFQHELEIMQKLKGSVVLVSGAGGSIGSELSRQISSMLPKKLILLDHSEFNLYTIDMELRRDFPQLDIVSILASIASQDRINKVFEEHKPDFVFHAAAYKHVPLVESNCLEAFNNNILGTNNLLHASNRAKVKKFVMISTDKAVDPSSVMGASKRVCEMLVKQNSSSDQGLQTAVVRFGNVINSSGSVIPLFKKQIEEGGPITVTHPDIERYFMSIPEAVRLVLVAGTLANAGEIYVLEMGCKLKIVDVARKMMALYGKRDMSINFIGLRPGEKLTEDLVCANEEKVNSSFNSIYIVKSIKDSHIDITSWVEEFSSEVYEIEDKEIGEVIKRKAVESQK